jgi:hypothetical protein
MQLHDTFGIRFEKLICTDHRWVDLSSMSQVKAHLCLGKEFEHVLQLGDRPSSTLPPVHVFDRKSGYERRPARRPVVAKEDATWRA